MEGSVAVVVMLFYHHGAAASSTIHVEGKAADLEKENKRTLLHVVVDVTPVDNAHRRRSRSCRCLMTSSLGFCKVDTPARVGELSSLWLKAPYPSQAVPERLKSVTGVQPKYRVRESGCSWGHIGTLFLCTNQEGREDALLNEEDVESLHECLEEVEEENEAQVAEDVDQEVEDNDKEPKGMEIVHFSSSEATLSKLPSELQFEWVNLPNLNFIGPQQYALLETDDQLGALDGVLDKKETESLELNA
ncbi:hypothetical protein PIB30_081054 [Stylosanthes scabra]|uniref:Uncharacterized protein n=1 Tax=Stylosanthes scabra TaxID=79078 RepID=A0ABU6TSB1_9FABA|nr:hypothetical protein [Stylosanthes scabra]